MIKRNPLKSSSRIRTNHPHNYMIPYDLYFSLYFDVTFFSFGWKYNSFTQDVVKFCCHFNERLQIYFYNKLTSHKKVKFQLDFEIAPHFTFSSRYNKKNYDNCDSSSNLDRKGNFMYLHRNILVWGMVHKHILLDVLVAIVYLGPADQCTSVSFS